MESHSAHLAACFDSCLKGPGPCRYEVFSFDTIKSSRKVNQYAKLNSRAN
jgi:hypothetical protein